MRCLPTVHVDLIRAYRTIESIQRDGSAGAKLDPIPVCRTCQILSFLSSYRYAPPQKDTITEFSCAKLVRTHRGNISMASELQKMCNWFRCVFSAAALICFLARGGAERSAITRMAYLRRSEDPPSFVAILEGLCQMRRCVQRNARSHRFRDLKSHRSLHDPSHPPRSVLDIMSPGGDV